MPEKTRMARLMAEPGFSRKPRQEGSTRRSRGTTEKRHYVANATQRPRQRADRRTRSNKVRLRPLVAGYDTALTEMGNRKVIVYDTLSSKPRTKNRDAIELDRANKTFFEGRVEAG